MVAVVAAQTEQLLPVHAHRVHEALLLHRVELTVDGGQCDVLAGLLEFLVQLTCGDEAVSPFERFADHILLPCVAHAVAVLLPKRCPDDGADARPVHGRL